MSSRLRSIGPAEILFIAGLAGLLAYAAWLGRDISFFSDDWPFIAFHHTGNYLEPYSGHLLLVPILILHSLWVTFGLSSYTPYLVMGLAFYAAVAITLFVYLRRQVSPMLAAVASLGLVWFSAAQFNVLFPILINFSIPVIAIVAVWALLDRNDLRCDIAASACVAIALASGGVGLVVTAAVGVELLALRAPIKRWLVFAPPVALWGVWYLTNSKGVDHPNSLGGTIRYAAHELQLTFAGFAGGWEPGGYVLAAAAIVLFALAIFRWHTFSARTASALVGVIMFAALTGYTPRHGDLAALPADTPRYLWLNAFFLIAAAIDVVRGRTLPRWIPAVAGVLVIVGGVTLVGNLRDYHQEVVDYKHKTQTYLYATEALGSRADQHRILPLSFELVRTGEYLDAVKHLGSPLENVRVRDLGLEVDRRGADQWMIDDLHLGLPERLGPSVTPCIGASPDSLKDLTVRPGSQVVVAPGGGTVSVQLRRLARNFSGSIGSISPGDGNVATLKLPKDHSSTPWHLRINGAVAFVSVCR